MTLTTILLIIAVSWLAYSNGANDNFKGVATLFGSGTTSLNFAIWWAMLTTLAGAIVAFYLGGLLIKAFSGKGLVGAEVLADPSFLFTVALAAAITVFLATRLGFPISTTHAIIGGLVGAGITAPGGVAFLLLGKKFLLPLILAPVLGVIITFILYNIFRSARKVLKVEQTTCLCIGAKEYVVATETPGLHLASIAGGEMVLKNHSGQTIPIPHINVEIDEEAKCIQRYDGNVFGIRADTILNYLHYFTAGAVGFARGLQDTAKIVGLLVGASLVGLTDQTSMIWGIGLVAFFMALGGLLSIKQVAETLSHKIADMNNGQGFTANLVTSILVIGSALWGWGVSTTHCSVGALFGIGVANGTARWKMITQIILAWLITMPTAAVLALIIYKALNIF